MLKNLKNPKKICTVICALLVLATLVMQFVPYWTYKTSVGSGETRTFVDKKVSIAGYVAFPLSHEDALEMFNGKDVTKMAEKKTGGFAFQLATADKITANTIAFPAGGQLLLGFLAVIFLILKSDKPFFGLVAVGSGALGLYGYLTVEPFALNSSLQIVGIVLSALVVIAGLVKFLSNKIFKEKANQQ